MGGDWFGKGYFSPSWGDFFNILSTSLLYPGGLDGEGDVGGV